MATQPTTPPSVTAWPTSPSRARPSTFATEADAFLGHFPIGQADQQNLVNWLNTTAGQAYTNALEAAASATAASNSEDAAAQSVIDANSILSSAFSQANYKGLWSSLSGALNIPASVLHNGGLWLLTTNIANVAASTPSETNPNWFLVFRKATDLDVENGTQYANPDAKQLKGFVQRNWSSLTTAKTYGDSCFYNGKEYVVRNPLTDPTIAPPSTAGRSYFEFDGTDDYITIPTINLVAGDIVRFKFRAPTAVVAGTPKFLIDGDTATNRLFVQFNIDGKILFSSGVDVKINGITVQSGAYSYPTDSLIYDVEITARSVLDIARIASRYSNESQYFAKSRIYDLEVIRSGTRIHYYPLRTDAIDYLEGNLVKDGEFTWGGNWDLVSTTSIANNSLIFNSTPNFNGVFSSAASLSGSGTYRVIYDYDIASGSINFEVQSNSVNDGATVTGTGASDEVLVIDNIGTGRIGIGTRSANTTGSIKNFRVIKLNELSPSASFTSATGFTLAGGVAITGGQAVFGAGTGNKFVYFNHQYEVGEKYRIVYKTNGTTTGSYRVNTAEQNTQSLQTVDGTFDYIFTIANNSAGGSRHFAIASTNGWDGNVEYFSVTKVTGGTESGSPVKTFDKHWQLTSSEQFLPSSAGLVKFGDNLAINSNNTLEIEPLSNGSRGDTIKLARKEGFTPIVKLSAADITAGKLIRYGVQTDTQLTLDTDKVATLIHNGTDLEVKI